MEKFICIHGHFYQPPRENPWLDDVEVQDTAYPFHDWNERITEECYEPNTASRILDKEGRIVDIVNLYSKISFNFGPTLLSWLDRHRPDVYRMILEADKVSRDRYGGHGSALAQVYNHMIMPLASRRDKVTQVRWGKEDFRRRFGREPEGMWLPETAVDLETLEVLADEGIKFTILAPRQAKRIRPPNAPRWIDVSGGRVDPTRPYFCRLPSGKHISLFFYDGPVSQDIAFGGLLRNGGTFANRLLGTFPKKGKGPTLVHVATDGETYGHHHRGGDMALAYCLYFIESRNLATLTNYGAYLADHPPEYEAEVYENSSWSCVHGVERWRSDCGCHSGAHSGWSQSWRSALREGMDWLAEKLAAYYEEESAEFFADPWKVRDDFVEILHVRDRSAIAKFLDGRSVRALSRAEKGRAIKLLELQKNAQLIYTSCGWFFDDITNIETIQVMRYAAQAIQYLEELGGEAIEKGYLDILQKAKSNVAHNGADVYRSSVEPAKVDHFRVCAHYGITSIFKEYPEQADVYCYSCRSESHSLTKAGRVRLIVGKVDIQSRLTWDEKIFSFAVLHLGDQNIHCGVRESISAENYGEMKDKLCGDLQKGDVTSVVRQIDWHFLPHTYSIWHLFKDVQREILEEVLQLTFEGIETTYRQIFEDTYSLMNLLSSMETPLPRPLLAAAEYICGIDLRSSVEAAEFDRDRLVKIISDIKRWSLPVDRAMTGFYSSARITSLMMNVWERNDPLASMEAAKSIVELLKEISVEFDLWKSQNLYVAIAREVYPEMEKRANWGEEKARRWVELFRDLGSYLKVRTA